MKIKEEKKKDDSIICSAWYHNSCYTRGYLTIILPAYEKKNPLFFPFDKRLQCEIY